MAVEVRSVDFVAQFRNCESGEAPGLEIAGGEHGFVRQNFVVDAMPYIFTDGFAVKIEQTTALKSFSQVDLFSEI